MGMPIRCPSSLRSSSGVSVWSTHFGPWQGHPRQPPPNPCIDSSGSSGGERSTTTVGRMIHNIMIVHIYYNNTRRRDYRMVTLARGRPQIMCLIYYTGWFAKYARPPYFFRLIRNLFEFWFLALKYIRTIYFQLFRFFIPLGIWGVCRRETDLFSNENQPFFTANR